MNVLLKKLNRLFFEVNFYKVNSFNQTTNYLYPEQLKMRFAIIFTNLKTLWYR